MLKVLATLRRNKHAQEKLMRVQGGPLLREALTIFFIPHLLTALYIGYSMVNH